ncbi:MAG: hypothetical protein Q4F05_18155 [bacterium]|nr:hypothetical protein [bacterium]
MNSLFKSFTLKSIYRRRKDWGLRFLLCLCSVTCIHLITAVYSIIENTEYEDLKKTYGSWNFSVYQTTSKTRDLLNQNILIDKIGTMTIYGTINSDSTEEANYIGSLDDIGMDMTGLTFEAGAAPKANNEIALEKNLLLKLGFDYTIGSPITVTYTNTLGETERISYILCGIVNSYHNTYLKQGPLVTAFVSNSFDSSIKYTEYINTFIKLKKDYHSQTIMNEIKAGALTQQSSTDEQWYYNSYIENSMDLSYQPIMYLLAASLLLIVALYHSFLFYFSERHHTLKSSQLMGMNNRMIFRIHLQESLFCIISSFLGGSALAAMIMPIYCGVLTLLQIKVYLTINYTLVGYSIFFSLATLILGVLAPCLYASFTVGKLPKLTLPAQCKSCEPKIHKSNTFILYRLVNVYKFKTLYFLLCNMFTILLLCILGVLSNYILKNILYIHTDQIIDYTIGASPFLSGTSNKEELISCNSLEKISQLDEVQNIIKYRYALTDSLTIIQLPEQEGYNYDKVTQTRQTLSKYHVFTELDKDPGNSCILYVPNQVSSSDPNDLLETLPHIGDTITFRYLTDTYNLKVVGILDETEFKTLTNSEACNVPCIFADFDTFNRITNSSEYSCYNYSSIIYNDITDPSVTTNIIDSILFSESRITTSHLNTKNTTNVTLLRRKLTLQVLFALFAILLSVAFQDSQRSIVEDYLEHHVHVLWYLGLSKKEIIKLYVKFYFYLISVSFTIALIFTTLYFVLLYNPGAVPLPFTLNLLLSRPRCIYFGGLYILCYLILYFLKSYKYIHKMINSF